VSVRARPPAFLKYLPKYEHTAEKGKPGYLAGAVYCNRTATGPELSRTEQDWNIARGIEIRLFMRISLTGWDGTGNTEAHS
jgi:hypothetical protein